MPDDDKQPSYERLDETNPEHNRRSFFDWLRGKEETDEEKLRKKLDEELKEAARTRAEQFEEERRTEEQREVAETRKLKKRWRAKLVEKSKALLNEAAELGDEPANGYEVAKLMVAERIVKLHDMLTDETLDLRRSEIKSLKIHIDFMGLLSEKLDTPELEVPEEIEQLYQTIASSVAETTGEAPPHTQPEHVETAPASEADASYTAFATSIVHAIQRAVESENAREALSSGEGHAVTPAKGAEPVPSGQTLGNPALAEQLLTIVEGTALSGEAIRKEITHTEQARQLADVVEKATIIDRYVVHEAVRPAEAGTPMEDTGGHTERVFDLGPNKKIKYLDDAELLGLAATLQVGGGRLLSEVYKSGEIDRAGLIKVLESYNKGQDYRSEFTSRREKWRLHRQASPEYLMPQTSSQTPSSNSTQKTQSTPEKIGQRAKEIGNRITSLALSPVTKTSNRDIGYTSQGKKSPSSAHALPNTPQFIGDLRARLQRQGQVLLLLATVLFIALLFFFVIT